MFQMAMAQTISVCVWGSCNYIMSGAAHRHRTEECNIFPCVAEIFNYCASPFNDVLRGVFHALYYMLVVKGLTKQS